MHLRDAGDHAPSCVLLHYAQSSRGDVPRPLRRPTGGDGQGGAESLVPVAAAMPHAHLSGGTNPTSVLLAMSDWSRVLRDQRPAERPNNSINHLASPGSSTIDHE
jgi:hypothetical protein